MPSPAATPVMKRFGTVLHGQEEMGIFKKKTMNSMDPKQVAFQLIDKIAFN